MRSFHVLVMVVNIIVLKEMYGHKNLFDFVTNCTAPSPETDQSGPLAAYYKLPLNRVLVVKDPISLSGSQVPYPVLQSF